MSLQYCYPATCVPTLLHGIIHKRARKAMLRNYFRKHKSALWTSKALFCAHHKCKSAL